MVVKSSFDSGLNRMRVDGSLKVAAIENRVIVRKISSTEPVDGVTTHWSTHFLKTTNLLGVGN